MAFFQIQFTYFSVAETEIYGGFGWKSISWPLKGFENLKN